MTIYLEVKETLKFSLLKKSVHTFRTEKVCCILEIQNWSVGDTFTNVTLTDAHSGVDKRLDLLNDIATDTRAGNCYVLLKYLDEKLTYKCAIDILDEDGNVHTVKSDEFCTEGKIC